MIQKIQYYNWLTEADEDVKQPMAYPARTSVSANSRFFK